MRRHGHLVAANGHGLGFREDRPGDDVNVLLCDGEVSHLRLKILPNATVELRPLGRHVAHEEAVVHRPHGVSHVSSGAKMSPVEAGAAVISQRRTPSRDLGIFLEFVSALRRLGQRLLFGESVDHPCGLFVVLDVAEGVSGAVDDGVRSAGDAELEVVELRRYGDDLLLLSSGSRAGNDDGRLRRDSSWLCHSRLRRRFLRRVLSSRSYLFDDDADALPRRGGVLPNAETAPEDEEQQEEEEFPLEATGAFFCSAARHSFFPDTIQKSFLVAFREKPNSQAMVFGCPFAEHPACCKAHERLNIFFPQNLRL